MTNGNQEGHSGYEDCSDHLSDLFCERSQLGHCVAFAVGGEHRRLQKLEAKNYHYIQDSCRYQADSDGAANRT